MQWLKKKIGFKKNLMQLSKERRRKKKRAHRLTTDKTKLERQLQDERDAKNKLEKQLNEEKESKNKSNILFNDQIKALTEANQNQLKKLKDEFHAELKKRESQTLEIAQKAEMLVRKQQERVATLETEIRLSQDGKRHHQKLCANLIGGVLTDEDASKLTPLQLELLFGEMELALQRLNHLIKKTGSSRFLPKSDLFPATSREGTRIRSPLFGSTSPIWAAESDNAPKIRESSSWILDSRNQEKSGAGKDLFNPSSILPSSTLPSEWSNFPNTEYNCRLCKSAHSNTILYPCGHSCICSQCATTHLAPRRTSQFFCSLCRLPIESWKSFEDSSFLIASETLS